MVFIFALTALFITACATVNASRFETIELRGKPEFKEQVARALALLKSKSPNAYETATSHVAVIQQGKHSGMWAYLSRPKFELNDRTAFYSITWCAGSIAHDSFHSKLYHDYLRQHPDASRVPDDAWKGPQAEAKCSDHQWRVLRDIGAPFHETDWTRETNQYWEVRYTDRNW